MAINRPVVKTAERVALGALFLFFGALIIGIGIWMWPIAPLIATVFVACYGTGWVVDATLTWYVLKQ